MASSVVQIDVRSLRSAQLQIELKKRGLSSSGKKSELRRRLEEALAKEKGEAATATTAATTVTTAAATAATVTTATTATTATTVTTATANNINNEVTVSDNLTTEQSTADKAVTVTTKDSTVASVTTAPSEGETDKAEDSKEKDTIISTTQESTAPVVTQEDKVAEPINSNQGNVQDKEVAEKGSEQVQNTTADQPEAVKPTTEAGSAEVSMEMDDLVVHTVDEDDFKIEEQSRDRVSKKSGELPSSTTDEQGEVDSPSVKKRKIHLQGSGATTGSSSERKRKWKSSSSKSSATTISSDVLKKIIPDSVTKEVTADTVDDVFPDSSTTSHDPVTKPDEDIKSVTMTTGTEDSTGEQERLRLAEEETRRRIEIRLREKQDGEQRQQQQQPLKPSDVPESDLTPNKEVIVDYNQPIRIRSPSNSRNPPSCILHITNLVRPFALSQLKDFLSEDGKVVTDGFWINKIKSHCFAVYESVDAAMATRNRLDGVRWPVTNPKVITVDYSNEEEVLAETGGALAITSSTVAMDHSDIVTTKSDTVKEKHVPKVEERTKQAAVVKEEAMQVEESTTTTTTTAATAQEGGAGAQEADNKSAVNRLDELFKKTIATPQIYWLPLTTEEGEKRLAAIKADEELRRQRREQRQKDREEKEKLEQEEREKRRKAREEEREKRKKQRSTSRHRSRSRSKHRSRSRSRHRSNSRSRHQR